MFARLTAAVEAAARSTNAGGADGGGRVLGLLGQAVQRKGARLRSAFDLARPLPAPAANVLGLMRQLSRLHRLWVQQLLRLADDGELDVRRLDEAGRARPTWQLARQDAFDDAALAGAIGERAAWRQAGESARIS